MDKQDYKLLIVLGAVLAVLGIVATVAYLAGRM